MIVANTADRLSMWFPSLGTLILFEYVAKELLPGRSKIVVPRDVLEVATIVGKRRSHAL